MLNTRIKCIDALRLSPFLGSVVLAFICTTPAYATTQIVLSSPGLVTGDIPLTSYSQNASNNGGASVCGQVTITKLVDRTSPLFLRAVLTNSQIPQMTINFSQQTGTTQPFTYYTIRLDFVTPTSITQSDNTTDIITEQIVLSAQRFRFRFFGQNPDGSPSSPIAFGFDCAAQTPL